MKLVRPIRLSTLLLAMIVLALLCGLYAQHRQEVELRSELAHYRDPASDAIFDVLDQPLALTYGDGAPLEVVLREAKMRSTGRPKLTSGIPIYVDPIGLQEAEKSMSSPVRKPPLAEKLTLGAHLKAALDSLDLSYIVQDGFLMITSKESLDVETGDAIDPYLQFRDVLR
jgi:hypothetical protein